MHTNLLLDVWMDCLQVIVPAGGVVHVGAGNGHAAVRYADWGIDTAVFIEADESFRATLAATLEGRSGWSMHTALVGDISKEIDFFVASNPNESGVFRPEILTGFWQNLKTRQQSRLSATTLESILAVSEGGADINWAIVDCVPALPVLRGAKEYLARWDVVIARVILDESYAPTMDGATRLQVDEFLSSRGYSCVAYREELQPSVGSAFYVRDWNRLYKKRLEDERRLATAHQKKEEQLCLALDNQTALAAERQAELASLAKVHKECIEEFSMVKEKLTAQIEDLGTHVAQLAQDDNDRRRLLNERETQFRELTRTHAELLHISQERSAQIDQLANAQAARAAELSTATAKWTSRIEDLQRQVARLTQEDNDRRRLLSEREKQLSELAAAHAELIDESQKCSAQVDQLSKDLHARGAEFSTATEKWTSQMEDLQRQIVQLTQECNDGRRLLIEREGHLSEGARALDEQTRLAAGWLSQTENLVAAEASLKQELLEARQSVSLAMKLQTLREADLKDLQIRYQESLSIRDQQHQILGRLGERLGVVSGYFHQLAGSRAALEHEVEEKTRISPTGRPNASPLLKRKSGSQTNSKQLPKHLPTVNLKSRHAKSSSKPTTKRKRSGRL